MKIAFIKFGGMGAGGIEKYLQTIAILLKNAGHIVDYFYTNPSKILGTGWVQPDNSEERIQFMKDNGMNLIPVHVDYKYASPEPCEWFGTDFWDLFKESNYDVIQTGRGGYPEYPFSVINNCPIVDSIHSFVGEDKPNIKKAILLCKWQADKWASNGGNINKVEIIPSIVKVPPKRKSNLREVLQIPEESFVYGLHQADRGDIFCPNSLIAYSKVENKNNYYVMLGGCGAHRETAQKLGIKNIRFLDFTSNVDEIHDFLSSIDVFAHSRSDGEVCSASIIEAMFHGKPVISHPALNMGHLEQIEDCGKVANSLEEYVNEMTLLENNKDYYIEKSEKTLNKYEEKYNYVKVENQFINLYNNLDI